jgi:hypothetical protein
MTEKHIYLPINAVSLSHYYGAGIILPSKCFPNKIPDVQNKFEDFLLMSQKQGIDDSNCCLNIVLSDEEYKMLQPIESSGEIFLYPFPLPISRIRNIYFNDADLKDRIVSSINIQSTAIQENIPSIISTFTRCRMPALTTDYRNDILPLGKIEKYDRILGALALMKASSDTEEGLNYPENYFPTLSFFNSLISQDLIKADKKTTSFYHDAFIGKSEFKPLLPYLLKKITLDDVNEVAKRNNQIIKKNKFSSLIDFSNLEGIVYIIAILYTYGLDDEAKSLKIGNLVVTDFKEGLHTTKSEVIAFCFGYNRGYSSLSRKYKVDNKEKIIKYELKSSLDYYTIESIYQFAFYDKTANSHFSYMDWVTPLNLKSKSNTYKILDEIVFNKKKPPVGSPNYISQLLQAFFQKDTQIYFKDLFTVVVNAVKFDYDNQIYEDAINKDEQISILENQLNQRNVALQQLNEENFEKSIKIEDISQQLNETTINLIRLSPTKDNSTFNSNVSENAVLETDGENQELGQQTKNINTQQSSIIQDYASTTHNQTLIDDIEPYEKKYEILIAEIDKLLSAKRLERSKLEELINNAKLNVIKK